MQKFDFKTKLPFFKKLGNDERILLNDNIITKKFPKGFHVHSGAEDCSGLIIVKSGQLRAFMVSNSGKELTLYRLLEDDICLFSASCILKQINFDIYVDAEKESQCYLIPTNIFQIISEKNQYVSKFINDLMSKRFSEVMWLIEHTLFKSFDERLASFLIDQSSIENSTNLKITHEEIANHIGSAREVVSRMLKHFQTEGILNIKRGNIEIINMNQLFLTAKI
jgi:CRP/FNR family transcriptional regulator